jgi:MFS family permease
MEQLKSIKQKPGYKWVIVASCFVMVMITLGFCSSTKPLYLSAITDALGIQRSLFSINDSCRFVTTAIVNLFFGALIAKFGPRKLIGAGFACLVASMLSYSLADTVLVFYIGGCLLGLGVSWTTTTMVGYVIDRWCKEHKGTIMGAVLAANGLGGAVAAQIVGPIISGSADGFGYRWAYRLTAIILLTVGVIVVALFKNAADNSMVDVPVKKRPKGNSWTGLSFEECLRTPYFYVACICIFLSGLSFQGVNGVYKAHMNDAGISDQFGTLVVSIHSLTLAAVKFLSGAIYDKKGLRFTVIICHCAAVVMPLILALSSPTAFGMTCAMGYGIISCVALPMETVMIPLIASDLFGAKGYAKVLGVFVSVSSAGYALGAPLTNLVYDMTGSYNYGFYAMSAVLLVIAIVFQFVITAAMRKKAQVCETC